MYIRPKDRNGYRYHQLVLGEKERKQLTAHGESLPQVITLPRAIFLPKNWSATDQNGKVEVVDGTVQTGPFVTRPDHGDYIHAVVDAAVDHYKHILKSTRSVFDRSKYTTRGYREHRRHEKAKKNLRLMYLCQRLVEQESHDRTMAIMRASAARKAPRRD